ncbi:MAG: hypothetical protein FE834_01960, partial [Gammaproteobacteria bacterium]|nr:hypothetical protein [Gammaproteobacteria bacterium]
MKTNNIKTIEALKTLQSKAKTLTKTLNTEMVAMLKGEQHIQVKPGLVYELNIKGDELLSKDKDFALIAKKVGKDLEVLLPDEVIVIFDDYFEICATDLSCLVALPNENGIYYVTEGNFPTLADGSQIVYLQGSKSALSAIAATQSPLFFESFSDEYLGDNTNLMAGVLAALYAACAGSGSSSSDPGPVVTTATIHKAIDSVGSNAGAELSSGASTDDTSPELIGTVNVALADNEHIAIYDGTSLLGRVKVADNGTDWNYTDTRTLSDGDKPSYTVKIITTVETVETEGATSSVFTLIIDIRTPDAPKNLKLFEPDDTGIKGDNLTNKTTVTITGEAEANSFVELFDGNNRSLGTTTTRSDGNFSKAVHLPADAAKDVTTTITAKAT